MIEKLQDWKTENWRRRWDSNPLKIGFADPRLGHFGIVAPEIYTQSSVVYKRVCKERI
jgi:hypothetical protein